jgi:glycosyltransferase involved in cell wall biosynthesis
MPYPANDGGTIATLNMIVGFAEHNDKVTVLAMQTQKHSYSVKNLPTNLTSKINWNQVFVDTRIKPAKAFINLLFSTKPYNAVRFESVQFKEQLIELLKNRKFDLVQLEGAYLDSYVSVIRKYSSAKISLRAHNVEHEIWERLKENEPSLFKKVYYKILSKRVKKLESKLLNRIDFLVPITERDSKVLDTHGSIKTKVSQTGMPNSKFRKKNPKYLKSVFYIGALDWIPNQGAIQWFLSEVWNKLQGEFPDWEFVIAGRNAPNSFESYLKTQKVKYIGEVASATDFIDDHNIMLVPLLSGSGMRIKIVEGMARGKCILTTSIGAEGIPAQNGKNIFIEDQPEQMASVLKNLMGNNNQIERCAENAFIFVQQNYNNHVIINELRRFYAKHLSIS